MSYASSELGFRLRCGAQQAVGFAIVPDLGITSIHEEHLGGFI
jgi:hypothetical protein